MNYGHPPKAIPQIMPFIEEDVYLGLYVTLGQLPLGNAATRRPVGEHGQGRIGARTIIGSHAVIYAGVVLGPDCRVGDHAIIRESGVIGARCVIGTQVDLQFQVTLGDDVKVQAEAQLAGGTIIGDGSFIGPGVQTANDPHVARFPLDDYQDRGQVAPIIGKRVFVGAAAIILPGVVIGDGAMVAAGALVTKDVPAGAQVYGMPARTRGPA